MKNKVYPLLLLLLFIGSTTFGAVGCLKNSSTSGNSNNSRIFTRYIGYKKLYGVFIPIYGNPSYPLQENIQNNGPDCPPSAILGSATGKSCLINNVRYKLYNYKLVTECDLDTYSLLSTLIIGTVGFFMIKNKFA